MRKPLASIFKIIYTCSKEMENNEISIKLREGM